MCDCKIFYQFNANNLTCLRQTTTFFFFFDFYEFRKKKANILNKATKKTVRIFLFFEIYLNSHVS